MRVVCAAGTRPNFVKIAPILEAAAALPELDAILVHTQQHAADCMTGLLLRELGIGRPSAELASGGTDPEARAVRIEAAFGDVVARLRPDLVLVVGDVDSTLACARAAAQLGVPVAHVEAGLRSFDPTMPEEKNRIAVDAISTWLFTTEASANRNLEREGIAASRVHLVGNVMIDTLVKHRRRAEELRLWQRLGAQRRGYAVLTLHRPSAVDDRRVLESILEAVHAIQRVLPVVFPLHPRTERRLEQFRLEQSLRAMRQLLVLPAMGYLEFLSLMIGARLVLTDSGGVQEETTALGVPCLTLRNSTERPVTLSHGTNRLVGRAPSAIVEAALGALATPSRPRALPDLWDGQAAGRILRVLLRRCRVTPARASGSGIGA
jgi:UDP-N-acetylglucosamine 2-epimerase (non-hydrolysing)